jgi:hypothetical protein
MFSLYADLLCRLLERSQAMSRTPPPERFLSLASVAAASRSEKVLVICHSRTVRRQYERAIPKLGGDLDNVVFRILPSRSKGRT